MTAARVLVVDDDPWILRMVTATLQKKQYVVDTAQDGRQALQKAQASPPDVVITDVMMPVMDGWAFVQQLRTIPHLAYTPVIFLTALGRDEATLRQMGIRPEDYLTKPFRFDDLEKRVTAALERRKDASAPGYAPTPGSAPTIVPGAPQGYPPQGYPPQGYPPQGYP
ncbi:MAG: response regulator, partial [Deltaproteobacteria bacterium]